MNQEKYRLQEVIVSVLDIIGILFSIGIATLIRNGNIWTTGIDIDEATILLFIVLVYIMVSFFRNAKQHFFTRGYYEELIDVIKGISWMMGVLIVALFFVKKSQQFSRGLVVLVYILGIAFVYILRSVYKSFVINVSKQSMSTKRLVIVTLTDKAAEILERLENGNMWDYKLKGFIFLDVEDSMIGEEFLGVPIMGNYNNMYDCITQRVVDEVFIHVPYNRGLHVGKAVETYENMGITVNLNIQVYEMKLMHRSKELRAFGSYYVLTFRQSVVDMKMRIIKRIIDIIGGVVGCVFTGIIMIVLAPILLLESPGPLIFSQTRVGLNGRKFKMYKFRSMYRDAEERKKELMAQNEMNGLMFKMENDPRITKVGKFIRKTSIDEFPQFWNVLKGDMSLIGTRPPTVDEFEQYKTEYKRRLSIRPGITGMWQVSGRSDIKDFEEVLALDIAYIDNWSLVLDIKILFQTVFGVFLGKGAK